MADEGSLPHQYIFLGSNCRWKAFLHMSEMQLQLHGHTLTLHAPLADPPITHPYPQSLYYF